MKDRGYTTVTDGHFTARVFHCMQELWWDEAVAKNCTVCKGETHWRRPRARGAATHPLCEGNAHFDLATDELYAEALGNLMTGLPVDAVWAVADTPRATERKPEARRLGNPRAGCSRCGRSHAALWVVARTWRCGEHPPAKEEYRRRW